jgi:hypothetical protein
LWSTFNVLTDRSPRVVRFEGPEPRPSQWAFRVDLKAVLIEPSAKPVKTKGQSELLFDV